MATVQWTVTVSDELNQAALDYLAKMAEGPEGLSNLVENAVGKYLMDPRAKDKASGVTPGEIEDMIAAAVDKAKEKYSGITAGQLNDMMAEVVAKTKEKYAGISAGQLDDMINAAVAKAKEKYSGITAGQFNDMINEGIDALKRAAAKKS